MGLFLFLSQDNVTNLQMFLFTLSTNHFPDLEHHGYDSKYSILYIPVVVCC